MLIDEIVDLAAGVKQPIGVLLRKCLILAYQTGNENLKSWAAKELNGYADDDIVPEYRVTPAQATRKRASGPGQTGCKGTRFVPWA